MSCKILRSIYGRDTRSAQVVNILLTGAWSILLLLHQREVLRLDIPTLINVGIEDITLIGVVTVCFATLGVATKGRRHQVFKAFGLSLGSVFYGILANGYFTAYPPLEMMLVVCLVLLLWFLGGLFYIFKCEGLDGVTNRR